MDCVKPGKSLSRFPYHGSVLEVVLRARIGALTRACSRPPFGRVVLAVLLHLLVMLNWRHFAWVGRRLIRQPLCAKAKRGLFVESSTSTSTRSTGSGD